MCLWEWIEEIIPCWCSKCARCVTNGAVLLYRVGSACGTVGTCITLGQIRENSRTDSEVGLYEFRKTADLWKPKWNTLNSSVKTRGLYVQYLLQARSVQIPFLVGLLVFFRDLILQPHYDRGVDSTSNWNEYQAYLLGRKGDHQVGLMTLPPSCTDFLEILGALTSSRLKGLSGL
jgi:hypothetical protein